MGTPVTGGNVSFYNQTGETAILPTPVVGVLGVIDDVTTRLRDRFDADGDIVLLLGTTRDELDGSEWAHEIHGHLGGRPPRVDLEAERALAAFMAEAAAGALLTAAHDLSDGGLAQSLVELAIHGGIGANVELGDSIEDRFVALFSESTARAVVTARSDALDAVVAAAAHHGVPVTRLGVVGGSSLRIDGLDVELSALADAHRATIPALFDHSTD